MNDNTIWWKVFGEFDIRWYQNTSHWLHIVYKRKKVSFTAEKIDSHYDNSDSASSVVGHVCVLMWWIKKDMTSLMYCVLFLLKVLYLS